MYSIEIHREALKVIKKSSKRIKSKIFRTLSFIESSGFGDLPYPIEPLRGKYKKAKYFEIKIDKDYRLIFRKDSDTVYIRWAGTHNQLRTG